VSVMGEETVQRASAPQSTGGYCSWHQSYSRTAVPVRALPDEGSGPAGRVLLACLPCRRSYDLIPLSEQPQ
jgi:hypothetical protein